MRFAASTNVSYAWPASVSAFSRTARRPCAGYRRPEAIQPYGAKIVGIVNLTEDSFSDGGRYLEASAALARARALVAAGASVVDLGAAASNPDARPVPSQEEIRRLRPVLDGLLEAKIQVSVDTWKPAVQRYCLERGISYLNDTRGFDEPAIYPDLARASCRLVVMHSVQRSGTATRVVTDAEAVWGGLEKFFEERIAQLTRAGIERERLILDPGMGLFLGSNPEPSLLVLARLHRLRDRFALPILVSVSRKSFLLSTCGRTLSERGPATLAAEIHAAAEGADYIRTHDVRALADALAVLRGIEAAER